jgi:hypothetical protein
MKEETPDTRPCHLKMITNIIVSVYRERFRYTLLASTKVEINTLTDYTKAGTWFAILHIYEYMALILIYV